MESEAFHTDLKRLTEGEPLAYVIGSVPFLNCTIYLDSHPLIPRPETEFWAEKAITEIRNYKYNCVKVLDLCAGSGAIGVAVAKAIPKTQLTFGEIEKQHLPTIGKNTEENNISCTRYKVKQSDLFKNIEGTFDFILTNPPYIDPALNRADDSVKNNEPHLALYGGKYGLEIIEKIIVDAQKYLNKNGQLWIEHEPEQVTDIHTCALENGYKISTHKDQYQVMRYSVLCIAN